MSSFSGVVARSMIALFLRCTALPLSFAIASPALAAGASMDDATEEQKASAKDKYQAGMAAFEKQKFEEALGAFAESYGIVASPNSHLMIARSLSRLNRVTDAYQEYALVLAEAQAASRASKKYEPTARAAQTERAELKQRLAFVSPRIEGSVSVAGKEVPRDQIGRPVPVDPGTVEVILRTASGETRTQIEAEAGREVEVALEPATVSKEPGAAPAAACPPASEAPPPEESGIDQRTLALVSGGVGVLGLATFGVFGALNNSKYDDIESQCSSDGLCPEGLADEGETGRQYQTIANVGLGVGVIGLGAGIVLWLTAPSRAPAERARRETTPRVDVTARSVSVSGRF